MPKKDTQFKKGVSGNPNGKPVGTLSFTTKVREALEKVTKGNTDPEYVAIVKVMLEKAKQGDFNMIKLILNYNDGLPKQSIDVTSKGKRVAGFNFIKPEDDTIGKEKLDELIGDEEEDNTTENGNTN